MSLRHFTRNMASVSHAAVYGSCSADLGRAVEPHPWSPYIEATAVHEVRACPVLNNPAAFRCRVPVFADRYSLLVDVMQCNWADASKGGFARIDAVYVGILHSVTGALASRSDHPCARVRYDAGRLICLCLLCFVASERAVIDSELMAIEEINSAGGRKSLLQPKQPLFADDS